VPLQMPLKLLLRLMTLHPSFLQPEWMRTSILSSADVRSASADSGVSHGMERRRSFHGV